jgi:type IV pilus assembly protein PilQ
MKKISLLLAVTLLAFRGFAQEESSEGDSGNNPPPVEEQSPPPEPGASEPEAMPDQPPPPAGTSLPALPRRMPSRHRFPNLKLGDQERELLDKHRENAARAKGQKPPKADSKSAAKTTGKTESNLLNVDYVDEPILDVLRAIATAFKLSVIPDKDLGDVKVTIHLENIPVIEGLDKLCRSSGLELIADGNVYRVRKTRETSFSIIDVRNKRMNLDVQNRPVKDFLREFVEKTKINIVPGQSLRGTVTGHLKDVEPIDGLKALMAANNYDVRLKNGVYLVENGDSTGSPEAGSFRRGRRNPSFSSGGNSDVDVHDGKVSLSLNNASLGDAIREIAEQAGLNYTIIGDVSGNVNAQLKGITVDEAMSALLQGTRYAYLNKNGTLLIGDRNPNTPSGQALSGAELVYLKFIKAENLEKIMPKSIPADNIRVIKEQNAVLISGTSDDINLVKAFLDKIDVPTPQVLMEVVVVEYNRNKDSEFGLAPGNTSYGSLNANVHGELSGVRETFKQGSFHGFIGLLPPKFDLSLRALESKNKAKVLAMPKVTTLNGNKAELRVSRTSYYQVNSVNKDGFQNLDFRTIDDGITIEITPWVTKHGEVNVSINPSIKTAEQAPAGAPPPITNRSVVTNVRLMDGETIALGGLINSKEDNRREFVPILGSIPVLGYLFSWRKALTQTTELVIYVTPHILRPESQGLNLEEEFENLDRRSGFLENSDFIKSSKVKEDRAYDDDSAKTAPPAKAVAPASKAAPKPAPSTNPAPRQEVAPGASKAAPASGSPDAGPAAPNSAAQRMKAVVDSLHSR